LKARRGLKSKCNTTTAQEQLCSNAGLFFFVLPAKGGEGAGRTRHTAAEPQYGVKRGFAALDVRFAKQNARVRPAPPISAECAEAAQSALSWRLRRCEKWEREERLRKPRGNFICLLYSCQ